MGDQTRAQLGLAISSLVVGSILAICTIPAALASHYSIETGLLLLPFALFAGVFGWFGRSSAMGVAGLCLSLLASFEAGGVLTYSYIKTQQEITIQREEIAQKKAEAVAERVRQVAQRAKSDAEATRLAALIQETKKREAEELARAAETTRQTELDKAKRDLEERLRLERLEDQRKREAEEQQKQKMLEEATRQQKNLEEKKLLEEQNAEIRAATQEKEKLIAAQKTAAVEKCYLSTLTKILMKDDKVQYATTVVEDNETYYAQINGIQTDLKRTDVKEVVTPSVRLDQTPYYDQNIQKAIGVLSSMESAAINLLNSRSSYSGWNTNLYQEAKYSLDKAGLDLVDDLLIERWRNNKPYSIELAYKFSTQSPRETINLYSKTVEGIQVRFSPKGYLVASKKLVLRNNDFESARLTVTVKGNEDPVFLAIAKQQGTARAEEKAPDPEKVALKVDVAKRIKEYEDKKKQESAGETRRRTRAGFGD
jgi:hypothetical protein